MTTTKKILLIGRSGRGKSTLANVLSETNKFKESSGSVSETRKIQFEEFADKENDTIYLVIDTPGIGDTKMSDNEVLDIIAEAVYLAKDGIDQVLFVIDGRFDQYEMITYDLLRTIIFDQNITKHTTIARTRFEDFTNKNECENNLKKMIEETEKKKNDQEREIAAKKEEMEELTSENEQYQKLLTEVEKLEKELKVTNLAEIIKSCQKRIVYIDNPPIEIAGAKDLKINRNKKKRVKSQKILLAHLKNNCQNDSYKPEKLTKLSEEITEDMDNLLQSRREYEEEMKKLKTSKSSSVNNQFAKITTEGNQEPTIENDDDFAVGEKATNQPTILQLESKRSKLRREIAEKEKLIRQKVLKHIFNNYNDIASVEGSSNFIDSMIDIDS